MNSQSSSTWGLFRKDNGTTLPLKSLHISVQIIHNISRIRYTQTYQNNTDILLSTEFFFPISPDACFDSFEAKFNDTTIKGVVMEKEKAKKQYNQAVEAGNVAAYSEINKSTGDLMNVLIGNIPPSSEVSITYSYIEKMEVSLNKFWCFRLFSCFTPRYNGDLNECLQRDIALLAGYPTVSKSEAYPWTIEVEVQSPSQIQFLQSPSHNIVTKYGNENHTCTITLDPKHNYKPNKDFVLLYTNGKENEVGYVMTPFENEDYCAMVTMIADFDKSSPTEAYDKFVKAKQTENSYEMDSIRGEYIFLIDRSGSMCGDRIKMAKASLQLFLKSLPKDSYYNVVSFGDKYSFLHPTSQKYSPETLSYSSKLVEEFSADMGGTEILRGLEKVYDSPPLKGYPRCVFLLTDGGVSNTQRVLQLIESNSLKIRTFTVGIGNGCSAELIQKGAFYGKGKHEFVQDNKDAYAKVISLLDASLCPTYSDLSFHAENFDALVGNVTPNPTMVSYLLNGQQITFSLFIRKDAFADNKKMTLELRLYDSRIQKERSVKIVLDKEEAMKNDMIPKLAIHDMLQRLEEQKKIFDLNNKYKYEKKQEEINRDLFYLFGDPEEEDEKPIPEQLPSDKKEEIEVPSEDPIQGRVLWSDKGEITGSMLELSVKYGVLCKETAFFCEIAKNNDEVKTLRAAKVIVPTVLSQDYWREEEDEEEEDDMGFCLFGGDEDCGGYIPTYSSKKKATASYQLAAAAPEYSSYAKKEERYEEEEADYGMGMGLFGDDDDDGDGGVLLSASIGSKPPSNNQPVTASSDSSDSYIEIIMKQTFEGHWDPTDKAIQTSVLASGKLEQAPKELNVSGTQAEKVWLTILVLVWLEVVFQKEKQAWRLIHQKGCDWLKSQGVNYEQVKDLGKSAIKA